MSDYQMEGIYAQDVVLWEAGIEVFYAREERTVTGVAGDELDPGLTLTGGVAATVAASVDGILLSKVIFKTGETAKQATVLVRDAVVNSANLGIGAMALGDVKAALELLGIVARDEPAEQGVS